MLNLGNFNAKKPTKITKDAKQKKPFSLYLNFFYACIASFVIFVWKISKRSSPNAR